MNKIKNVFALVTLTVIFSSNLLLAQKTDKKAVSNKDMVLTALKDLFIKGDTAAVAKYWSPNYIQHNPMFPNGIDVLKGFAKNKPANFKFEPGLVIEDGQFVMVHSRYTGFSPKPMIIVDIFRVVDKKITEHWDIMQEEVPAEQSANGNPMFPIK